MNQLDKYLRVPDEFLTKFPELTEAKAKKHYNTYLATLRKVLLKRLPFIQSTRIHLPLKKMGDEMGKFEYNTNRYYIWKEFKNLRPFFFIDDDKKGNGRKKGNPFEQNSEVYIMNQKLIDMLIDSSNADELVSLYYGELDEITVNSLEVVPVDINSLNNFISNTVREIEKTERNSKHEAALYRNLRQAKYIKIISEFFYSAYNQHVLPQIPKPSPYGRVYYKGINVQNITKEVRNACLGEHYVYDLNAAVYAIKLMMAKKILKDSGISDFGHFTYTKEYLEWKTPLRKKLANHITAYHDGEKLVKEAITAIGFGARIGGGSWLVDGEWQTTSIEDIIMNSNDRQNFMNDPWIKKFVKEQQVMSRIISDDFIKSEGFTESVINVPNMFKNNKIRKSQVMSYVFQHTEKMIMDIITENIPVIARVHDSFITKNKLSNQQLTEIKYKLNNIDPLMTIGCEEFHDWINRDILDDEEDHYYRIQQEEQLAKSKGYNTSTIERKMPKIQTYNRDHECYDGNGYDGSGYENYKPDNDEYVQEMTKEERENHYRIVGYNPNKLPDFISDIMTK